MIFSFNIPEFVAYQKAALELLDIERDIESRRNAKSHRDEKMIANLVVKRDRLRAKIAPLKLAAEAAERAALERLLTPMASLPAPRRARPDTGGDADGLDIPAFLRRRA
jgi:hypothetical protein